MNRSHSRRYLADGVPRVEPEVSGATSALSESPRRKFVKLTRQPQVGCLTSRTAVSAREWIGRAFNVRTESLMLV